jgi:hypothetical protein
VTRGITTQVIRGTVSAVVIPSLTAVNRILRLEPLPTWTRGTVALLGDAAQAMEPNLGQGAAQAIEDAEALPQPCPAGALNSRRPARPDHASDPRAGSRPRDAAPAAPSRSTASDRCGTTDESQVGPLPSAPDSRRARIRSQIRTSCFTSRSLSPSNISSWIVEE